MEFLSCGTQAIWTNNTFVVNGRHRLVTRVSWELDLVILDNVLFDDGVPVALESGLVQCELIKVGLWDESVVTWNMRSGLCRSHCELVPLIFHLLTVLAKLISWVITVCS